MNRNNPSTGKERGTGFSKAEIALLAAVTLGSIGAMVLKDNGVECNWQEVTVRAGDTMSSMSGGDVRGQITADNNPDVDPGNMNPGNTVISVCLPPEDGR